MCRRTAAVPPMLEIAGRRWRSRTSAFCAQDRRASVIPISVRGATWRTCTSAGFPPAYEADAVAAGPRWRSSGGSGRCRPCVSRLKRTVPRCSATLPVVGEVGLEPTRTKARVYKTRWLTITVLAILLETGSGCGKCAQRAFRRRLMRPVTLTSSLIRILKRKGFTGRPNLRRGPAALLSHAMPSLRTRGDIHP